MVGVLSRKNRDRRLKLNELCCCFFSLLYIASKYCLALIDDLSAVPGVQPQQSKYQRHGVHHHSQIPACTHLISKWQGIDEILAKYSSVTRLRQATIFVLLAGGDQEDTIGKFFQEVLPCLFKSGRLKVVPRWVDGSPSVKSIVPLKVA